MELTLSFVRGKVGWNLALSEIFYEKVTAELPFERLKDGLELSDPSKFIGFLGI